VNSETISRLRILEAQHRSDVDGGYALVASIREWANTLDPDSRNELRTILLKCVLNEDADMWGVALETLVHVGDDRVTEILFNGLGKKSTSDQWTRDVILALLRLGYAPVATVALELTRTRLFQNRQRNVLPVLAATCRVDREGCLAVASSYFASALTSPKDAEVHRGYISVIVSHFLDVDEGLLRELIQRTKTMNSNSATRLVGLFEEYLTRPYLVDRIGVARASALRQQIRSA
jgi:hypothetical protein